MVGALGAVPVTRAAGLALGVGVDALVGDPRRGHPVAALGRAAAALEQRMWADSRRRGLAYAGAVVAPAVGAAVVADRRAARHPAARVLLTATVTWAVVGARSLRVEGTTMAAFLEQGDLTAARARLHHLCGRSSEGLDASELARATVESLAENTADAVVGSLVWGGLLGVPGLVLHRVANTLDAMVGNRSPRYARFGTASARLDDALGLGPARLTGALAAVLAPVVGGGVRTTWAVLLRDHGRHPSPNAGWCEAAWAAALGVTLGGRNVYSCGTQERPLLGAGPRPGADEVRRGTRLVSAVTAAATAAVAGALLLRAALTRSPRRRR